MAPVTRTGQGMDQGGNQAQPNPGPGARIGRCLVGLDQIHDEEDHLVSAPPQPDGNVAMAVTKGVDHQIVEDVPEGGGIGMNNEWRGSIHPDDTSGFTREQDVAFGQIADAGSEIEILRVGLESPLFRPCRKQGAFDVMTEAGQFLL